MNLGAENYFTDFRAFLDDLERRGKLYRWRQRVNKDTELMPLMRLQYRGLPDDKRQVLLFENVCDSNGRQYGVKVATGMYGSSRTILGLGMGCEDPQEQSMRSGTGRSPNLCRRAWSISARYMKRFTAAPV